MCRVMSWHLTDIPAADLCLTCENPFQSWGKNWLKIASSWGTKMTRPHTSPAVSNRPVLHWPPHGPFLLPGELLPNTSYSVPQIQFYNSTGWMLTNLGYQCNQMPKSFLGRCNLKDVTERIMEKARLCKHTPHTSPEGQWGGGLLISLESWLKHWLYIWKDKEKKKR